MASSGLGLGPHREAASGGKGLPQPSPFCVQDFFRCSSGTKFAWTSESSTLDRRIILSCKDASLRFGLQIRRASEVHSGCAFLLTEHPTVPPAAVGVKEMGAFLESFSLSLYIYFSNTFRAGWIARKAVGVLSSSKD